MGENFLCLKLEEISTKKNHSPVSTDYSFIVLMKKDNIVTILNSAIQGVNICEVWKKNDNTVQ